MTATTETRIIRIWDRDTATLKRTRISITVDLDKIADILSDRASKSKTGKATALSGAVVVEIDPMGTLAAAIAKLPRVHRISIWDGSQYVGFDDLVPYSETAYGNVFVRDGEMAVSALVGRDLREFAAAAIAAGAVETGHGLFDTNGLK